MGLSGDDLSGANLTDATLGVCTSITVGVAPNGCGGVDLSNANLTGANVTGANLTNANLTGANLTGTILVPSNQSLTATSQAGATVTWSTPPALPGATPGACTPGSGSTFPLFATTVTCQVLDAFSDVATGTFQVNVATTTQFFTRVVLPADGATLAGAPYLDALAADSPGVTNVVFELSGGPSNLSDQVIATATPTYYGWLAKWNTTSVPNGSYTLQSVATDADKNTDTSTPVSITVNNPPTTTIIIPANGATLSANALLDATATNATGVTFLLFGGIYGFPPRWSARPRRPTTDGCAAGIRRLSPTATTPWCLRPPGRVGMPSARSASPSRTERQAVGLDWQGSTDTPARITGSGPHLRSFVPCPNGG